MGQARVDEGSAYTLARLADSGIGQTNDDLRRQAAANVHLNVDEGALQADQGKAGDFG